MTLLSLALSLLIAAQQPNVPQSLKNEAISLAEYAIQQYESPSSSPVASSQPSISVPTTISQAATLFGSVSASSTQTTCVPNPVLSINPVDNGQGRKTFDATYSTGCPLDVNTPISYSVIVGSTTVQKMQGTIDSPDEDSYEQPVWQDKFKWEPSPQEWSSWGIAEDMRLSTTTPVTFDVTVGSSTREVIVQ